jgi:hypothetical protein
MHQVIAVASVSDDSLFYFGAVISLEAAVIAGTVFFILPSIPADLPFTNAIAATDSQNEALTALAPIVRAVIRILALRIFVTVEMTELTNQLVRQNLGDDWRSSYDR